MDFGIRSVKGNLNSSMTFCGCPLLTQSFARSKRHWLAEGRKNKLCLQRADQSDFRITLNQAIDPTVESGSAA
ncbi:MAG: hypothetical protein AAFV95_07075 [Bacteroidota bacterium]